MASIFKKLTKEDIEEPRDLSDEELRSATKKLIWKTKVQSYVRRVEVQDRNCQSIFSIIWKQCSTGMKNRLQSLCEYESKSDTYDCVWLLKEIKAITLRFEGTRYIFLSLDDARTTYYGYVQSDHQTLSGYLNTFNR